MKTLYPVLNHECRHVGVIYADNSHEALQEAKKKWVAPMVIPSNREIFAVNAKLAKLKKDEK